MVYGKYSANKIFTIFRVATTKYFFHTSDSIKTLCCFYKRLHNSTDRLQLTDPSTGSCEDLCKPNRLLVINFPERVPSRGFSDCEIFVKFR